MKRFITHLEEIAKRTLFGKDGNEPVRSGVISYVLEGLEDVFGFFCLIVLPGIAGACAYHWIFD